MSNELLPCPFCGFKPYINEGELVGTRNYEGHITDVAHASVGCEYCGIEFFSGDIDCCKDPAKEATSFIVELWNKRAERTCKPISKPNVWGFSDYYCECGNKLLEVANGLDEFLPNYCSKCGAKVVE